MVADASQLETDNKRLEQLFDATIDNIKELVLSRAWCQDDYDAMATRIELIREHIKTNCYINAMATKPALIEHIVMLLLTDTNNKDAYLGLDLLDSMIADYEC